MKSSNFKIVILFLVILVLILLMGNFLKPYFLDIFDNIMLQRKLLEARDDPGLLIEEMFKPYVIVLDPGHQQTPDHNKDPKGPGSDDSSPRVAQGTKGVITKRYEYEVVLEIANKVKQELERQENYIVIMTREENDVNISNKERAHLAANNKADIHIQFHLDNYRTSIPHGISAIHPSRNNPYLDSKIIMESERLAEILVAETVKITDARNRGVFPRDDLSVINWSQNPIVLLEMGFMSNPEEDVKVSDPDYQELLANGIVTGIGRYFTEKNHLR